VTASSLLKSTSRLSPKCRKNVRSVSPARIIDAGGDAVDGRRTCGVEKASTVS
jgi:hypothetical protein